MNISSHLVPQIDRAEKAMGRMATAAVANLGSAVPTAPRQGPVDVITLSDAAKAAIAESNKAHGKSADSPAHVAREQFMAAKIASGAMTTDIRFGDVVSRIARGISTESLFGAAPESDDDGSENTTKIAAADGEPATTTTTGQEENIIPTESNMAALENGAPVAGDIVKIAAVVKPTGEIDILDLLSSDEGDSMEVIV